MKTQLADTSVDVESRAWALMSLSMLEGVEKPDLDGLAESLWDALAKDRLITNEIIPAVRLASQFPFSTPGDVDKRIRTLKLKEYAPAKLIREVSEQGLVIDLFNSNLGESWTLALHATEVAFAVYALVATGYYEIVGFPVHRRHLLEEAVEQYADLRTEKAVVIPTKYVKWYNAFALVVWLQIGGLIGGVVAAMLGDDWKRGALAGVALAALVGIASLYKHDFVIVGMWDWLIKQLEKLIGALK
jgi:hypothetical protein